MEHLEDTLSSYSRGPHSGTKRPISEAIIGCNNAKIIELFAKRNP